MGFKCKMVADEVFVNNDNVFRCSEGILEIWKSKHSALLIFTSMLFMLYAIPCVVQFICVSYSRSHTNSSVPCIDLKVENHNATASTLIEYRNAHQLEFMPCRRE
jgi:hypothetical protein